MLRIFFLVVLEIVLCVVKGAKTMFLMEVKTVKGQPSFLWNILVFIEKSCFRWEIFTRLTLSLSHTNTHTHTHKHTHTCVDMLSCPFSNLFKPKRIEESLALTLNNVKSTNNQKLQSV